MKGEADLRLEIMYIDFSDYKAQRANLLYLFSSPVNQ